ncbi:MAG: ABC transporter permease [Candidatus Marinimicrobia bacterium]|jgi:ABC-type dipeptide/oligopeptide/nickel transport system permease component|nr:ABC transporter permease [Candidatus Neomarinimicrobiota bacterium]MBT3617340.1 ABC transporter permease [Candidatus Neomarinimicrobiota bacterium]MBT3829280.1 ABC transporter permease [Candidatus Neomarinimicrobiota bacterium]MBT3998238.1 ABC transporter permease [Candidatus Neomarinimicrobiota bacterium]MBT4281539.1 ABC transporter permease [Candidatus Neomarinimicrobiota bacterium]
MVRYIIKRVWQSIPVILGVIIITFILMYIIPGDPVISMVGERFDEARIQELREDLHLNDPLWKQFTMYLSNVVRGDLGTSFITGRSVTSDLLQKFPNTALLAASAMFIAVLMGVSLGVISSLRPNSLLDRGLMVFALAGISTPVFWLGLMLAMFVGVYLQWLPPTGFGGIEYLILPAITLGVRSAAYLARITRASMLDVLNKDYIRTARSKRVPEWLVVMKHAFPNVLIPVITVIGTDFGSYLSGAVLTESIFGWPGIGRFALEAILKRDFPVIQGTVLFMALMFITANMLVDILYGVIDPRIRMESNGSEN